MTRRDNKEPPVRDITCIISISSINRSSSSRRRVARMPSAALSL